MLLKLCVKDVLHFGYIHVLDGGDRSVGELSGGDTGSTAHLTSTSQRSKWNDNNWVSCIIVSIGCLIVVSVSHLFPILECHCCDAIVAMSLLRCHCCDAIVAMHSYRHEHRLDACGGVRHRGSREGDRDEEVSP